MASGFGVTPEILEKFEKGDLLKVVHVGLINKQSMALVMCFLISQNRHSCT